MPLKHYNLRRWLLVLAVCLLLCGNVVQAQDGYIRSPRLGITFISSLDYPRNEPRYQRALLLGVGWNRWPLYWNLVEKAAGSFDWSQYDRLVSDDLQHGLQINVILLGRPPFYEDGGSIDGLWQPVFADGTDVWTPGKLPNPAHPWANFVYQAVMRYKPGGGLATQSGWAGDVGITVWEAWNEPDFDMFWTGSVEAYARLLKVTYLAAHAADPNAKVMFGGLAYNTADDWLAKVLAIYARDPAREANNWFMDQVAVHSYTYPRRSDLLVRRVREDLEAHDLQRPIWLNESGVPVWDDYPGPTWATRPAEHVLRATIEQQAAYLVQSTVYAWAEGADVVFFHQLFDDCGNQAFGTNFPPNDGSLCANGGVCWGDAHGLYRNNRDSACFSQHPLPGTPRPAVAAFYRLAQLFGAAPVANPQVTETKTSVQISFDQPTLNQHILVIWNRTLGSVSATIPAVSSEARLYSITNDETQLTPVNGKYKLSLPPATYDGYPYLQAGDVTGIGGPPLLLVERQDAMPANLALLPITSESSPAQTLTPTLTPTIPPTVDPAFDHRAPVAAVVSLPATSPTEFTVSWSGQDDSGIQSYVVFVRVNGGEWQPWQQDTTVTSAVYQGASGSTYDFAAWAVDLAGNWSANVELQPQASTRVE
ncbi:MAG TPA: hypothetical protein VHO69_10335 [Phototrophicaceae bacterium]|nr:hypothetical protein [Phototrophicaceae bacterium]